MKYEHIIFDIDGTLIDSEYATLNSLKETLFQLEEKKVVDINDLHFVFGITGEDALKQLGIKDIQGTLLLWNENFKKLHNTLSVFDGIKTVLTQLKQYSYKIGIITSKDIEEYKNDFLPFGINEYFDYIICSDDTILHKPNPEPMNAYLQKAGIDKSKALYIGDSFYDMECALGAGVDSALALWGCNCIKHIKATYYLNQPYEIINLLEKDDKIFEGKEWLSLAMELQFIAQAGITYSKDAFDLERFERIREISAEILNLKTNKSLKYITDVFCNETGFQTPKLDSRAVIFQNNKILLVKEKNNKWSLPGGWVDINQSIKSNTIKEVKEEAGLDIIPTKLIALHDRNKHNIPLYAYGICKVFVLCEILGGNFQNNIETTESDFFSLENLPDLSEDRTTEAQIKMCFEAHKNKSWEVLFD